MRELLNRSIVPNKTYPEKILQVGEGNFLRAFVDWMVQKMNERLDYNTGIVIIQPRERNKMGKLNAQEGLYTVRLTGLKDGEVKIEHDLIDCVTRGINTYENYEAFMEIASNPDLRIVVSNTTEAGIEFDQNDRLHDTPPSTFPGKLTKFLLERFGHFNGDVSKGVIVLPTELIDRNGDALLRCVREYADLWRLSEEFLKWLHSSCTFCNSLVDRIVPGFPEENYDEIAEELGYDDKLLVEGEHFHLWAIEASGQIEKEFPAHDAGLNVIFTHDLEQYRTRKVRILNGAHTSMTVVGLVAGVETVLEAIGHAEIGPFIEKAVYDDIVPLLEGDGIEDYAGDILDRFRNPYIKHQLSSIALNSVSKFKTRVLPSLMDHVEQKGELPQRLVLVLAALIRLYEGTARGEELPLNDDKDVIEFIRRQWRALVDNSIEMPTLVNNILGEYSLWGEDLTSVEGLERNVSEYLVKLNIEDPEPALIELIKRLQK